MKKILLIFLILLLIAGGVVAYFYRDALIDMLPAENGYVAIVEEEEEKSNGKPKIQQTPMNESRQIIEDYIKNSYHYTAYKGSNLKFIDSYPEKCSYCWTFVYQFDAESDELPENVFGIRLSIPIEQGEIGNAEITNLSAENDISSLFKYISKKTNVEFSESASTEFYWIISANDNIKTSLIKGVGISVQEAEFEPSEIAFLLEDNGFETDLSNITEGIFNRIEGFVRDDEVCVLVSGISGGEAGFEGDTVKYNVEVKCGELETET